MPLGQGRFDAYIQEMTGGTDDIRLPIMAMNPMAKPHLAAFVDALIHADAERALVEACRVAAARLAHVPGALRVALVPMDDVGGGWTDRHLSDAQHRFESHVEAKRGFATAYAWASEPVDTERYREVVLESIYRAAYVARHGNPRTVGEALVQEGAAMRFAGRPHPVEPLAPSLRARVEAHHHDARRATLFAIMYGDDAARRVGHAPLGFPAGAGFVVALADAWDAPPPERRLASD